MISSHQSPLGNNGTKPIPVHVMGLDEAIAALRAEISTLPDATCFHDCLLNAPHVRAYRDRLPTDPVPTTWRERDRNGGRKIRYTPPRIVTVGDLKALSNEELIGLPLLGRHKIFAELCRFARNHGLRSAITEDPARVAPAKGDDRILHALALGFTVARVKHRSNTGRTHSCVRAYEVVDGRFVETPRTDAYNHVGDYACGMASSPQKLAGLISTLIVQPNLIYSLTEAGRTQALRLTGHREPDGRGPSLRSLAHRRMHGRKEKP